MRSRRHRKRPLQRSPNSSTPQDGHSLRDEIAHWTSVQGGHFTVSFRPGQDVAVELDGGGEQLPFSADPDQGPGHLAAILLDRLVRFENAFMELTAHLPAIAQAREVAHAPRGRS
jgi:hypothetical protein